MAMASPSNSSGAGADGLLVGLHCRIGERGKPVGWHFVGLLVAIVIGGAILTGWTVDDAVRQMREARLAQTRVVAEALDAETLATLVRTNASLERPEFSRLRKQLASVKTVCDGCLTIRLVARKQSGRTTTLASDEAQAGENTSSPATDVHPRSTFALAQVFDSGADIVEGPLTGQDGTWVTVGVPIRRQASGELIAVLTMDYNAKDWNSRIIAALILPILLIVALLGFVLAGWRIWGRNIRRGSTSRISCLQPEPAVLFSIGIALTIFCSVRAYQSECNNRYEAFRTLANSRASLVADTFNRVRDTELESLARFYEGSEHVTLREFREFSGILERDSAVYAWAWVPVVPASQVAEVETTLRAEGYPDFSIWQLDSDGDRVPAVGRAVYCPVLRVVPFVANRRVLGYDFISEPVRRAAFEEAEHTGLITATEPTSLMQDEESLTAMLVCRPVFQSDNYRKLRGCAVAALHMNTLLTRSTVLDDSVLFEIALVEPGLSPRQLAASWGPIDAPTSDMTATRLVFAFGKVFALKLHAGLAFERSYPLRLGWLVGLIGVVISGAIAAGANVACRRREELEHLVAARTRELGDSNARFNQLAEQSSTFHWEVDANGCYTFVSGVVESVCGYQPDELVGKKCLYDLHPEMGREAFKAAATAVFCRREPIVGMENPIQAKDGRIVWVATNGIPLIGENGELLGYRGSDIDITERMRAYEALEYAHEQLSETLDFSNSVFATMPIAVFVKDREGRYLDCNKAFAEMHGLTRDDIRGKTPDVVWSNEQGRRCRESDCELLKTMKCHQEIMRVKNCRGEELDVLFIKNVVSNSTGEVVAIIGAHVDITRYACATTAGSTSVND